MQFLFWEVRRVPRHAVLDWNLQLWIPWWIMTHGNRKIACEWKIPIWIIEQVPTGTSIYLIVTAAGILGQKLFCTYKLQLSANRFLAWVKVTSYLSSSVPWPKEQWSLSFHLALPGPIENKKGYLIASMSWQRKFHIVSLCATSQSEMFKNMKNTKNKKSSVMWPLSVCTLKSVAMKCSIMRYSSFFAVVTSCFDSSLFGCVIHYPYLHRACSNEHFTRTLDLPPPRMSQNPWLDNVRTCVWKRWWHTSKLKMSRLCVQIVLTCQSDP